MSPLPIITEFGNLTKFNNLLVNNPGLIIIKFGAEWCKPCKLIQNQVEKYMQNSPDNVQCCIIDIDEDFEVYAFLKNKKMVNGIPNVLCWYKNNIKYIPDDIVTGANSNEIELFFKRCANKMNI